jgi:hypothetical protein
MYTYNLDSVVDFGKYEGCKLKEILAKDPSYIEWCICNLDYFLITNEDVTSIIEAFPSFSLTEFAKEILSEKQIEFENEGDNNEDQYYSSDDYYEPETYDNYCGSYAQDVERLSDNFIDDVLEGDPDLYWNID